LNGQRSLDVLDTLGGAQPFPDSLVFPAGGSAQTNRTILNLGYSGGAVSLGLRGFFQQRQFNVTDSIAKVFGQHEIKIGVDYLRLFPISQYPVSTLSYTFTGIAQALQGTTTLSNVNQTRTLPILSSVSTYAQDTWHLRSHLAVTYGLRWDYASPLHSSDGHDPLLLQTQAYSSPSQLVHKSQLWQPSYKNFAPRVGIAYSLPEGNGAMTVLRGGFGLFYDTGTGDTWRAYPIGFPDNYRKTTSNIPFPVPAQVAVPFPVDLNNPGTSTLFYFPNSLKSPYSYQWNVTLEQAINSSQSISAGYVGAIGRDLLRQESISVTGGPLIFSDGNDGSSDYHSLQVQYRCHLSFGIQCLASYTFGKSIDTLSNVDAQVPPVSRINSQQDRGLSDFNAAHVFNGAVTVSLPAVKTNTLLKHLTSHWSIDGMVVARSALPVNLLITRDIGFGSTSLRPDLISNVPLYVADPNVAGGRRFNKQAFQTPSAQRQGSLGRNVLAGFPLRQLDAGVQRSFAFRERLTLSTRIEVFNVLNHPNFGPPSGSLTSGLFGISTAMQNQSFGSAGISGALLPAFQSGGPRDLQISMKLQF